MESVGVHTMSPVRGDLIRSDIGCTPITAGRGCQRRTGDGRLTTTVDGLMIPTMGGSGCLGIGGRLLTSHGGMATDGLDGRHCRPASTRDIAWTSIASCRPRR